MSDSEIMFPALITAGVACSMLLLIILLVLLLLYHRHPQMWQQLCSKTSQNPNQPPAFSQCTQRNILEESPGGGFWIQGNQIFCVGSTSSYQLPSYESLQEKDGPSSINRTGPEKPGLQASTRMESPPSYEEAIFMPPPCYEDMSRRFHQPPPILPASPCQLGV